MADSLVAIEGNEISFYLRIIPVTTNDLKILIVIGSLSIMKYVTFILTGQLMVLNCSEFHKHNPKKANRSFQQVRRPHI